MEKVIIEDLYNACRNPTTATMPTDQDFADYRFYQCVELPHQTNKYTCVQVEKDYKILDRSQLVIVDRWIPTWLDRFVLPAMLKKPIFPTVCIKSS